MKLQRFVLFTACLGLASAASATTIIVRPDGSGDYPTIQRAVDAAEDGDIILLESGTFVGPENRDVLVSEKSISIRGEDPSTCVIDCQDMGRAFRLIGRYTASSIAGLTIVHGRAVEGGAVNCDSEIWPEFADCVFDRNSATASGGAIATNNRGLSFVRCRFTENSSAGVGGAYYLLSASDNVFPEFEQCEFAGNTAGYEGGAVYLEAIALRSSARQAAFRGCTFWGNSTPGTGGAMSLSGMSPTLSHCTLVGNSSAAGGVIDCRFGAYAPASPVLSNSIIAFSTRGAAITCGTACFPVLTCSDLYGNAGGDWVGCIANQGDQRGNLDVDPLFCDPGRQDYGLASGSPCAPDHNPDCGLIGVWPVGCAGPVPVTNLSWGALKFLYK
jgi:predicted outer membrane repeat protein